MSKISWRHLCRPLTTFFIQTFSHQVRVFVISTTSNLSLEPMWERRQPITMAWASVLPFWWERVDRIWNNLNSSVVYIYNIGFILILSHILSLSHTHITLTHTFSFFFPSQYPSPSLSLSRSVCPSLSLSFPLSLFLSLSLSLALYVHLFHPSSLTQHNTIVSSLTRTPLGLDVYFSSLEVFWNRSVFFGYWKIGHRRQLF